MQRLFSKRFWGELVMRIPSPGGEWLACLLYGIAGFFYGIGLLCIGIGAAGAGHGTYVVMGLYSSPLGLTGEITIALFGTPVVWCATGALVGAVRYWPWRIAFLIAMAVHYAALPIILSEGSPFGDWSYAEKHASTVTFGVSVYVAGQLVLWILFVLGLLGISPRVRPRTPEEQPG
jgi:hypothetical protein